MKQPSSARSDKPRPNFRENVREYLVSSTLHGLRYIGTATLSVFERVFFGVSFFMVVVLAAYFISNVYQKWRETPVIIGLDPVSTNINEIPFPAVTICNMNQVKKSFAASLTTQKDKIILDSICTQGDNINDENENVEGRWSYVREFLLNSSQSCDAMIQLCRFGKERVLCDTVFKSVLTDEGLCCTFNAVHPKLMFNDFDQEDQLDTSLTGDIEYMTWTPEGGYENSEQEPYPYPVPGSGKHMGLTLMVNADVNNYYCSSTSSSGFKLLLHSPIETPKVANYGFSIATGVEANVVINPRISEASELIRKIPIKQRQCIFANEANLSYYKIYSKKNCEMECSSKTTELECGCTLYYMPRNNNGSKICNRKKAACYEQVLYDIAQSVDDKFSCNYCLPACYGITRGVSAGDVTESTFFRDTTSGHRADVKFCLFHYRNQLRAGNLHRTAWNGELSHRRDPFQRQSHLHPRQPGDYPHLLRRQRVRRIHEERAHRLHRVPVEHGRTAGPVHGLLGDITDRVCLLFVAATILRTQTFGDAARDCR